MLALLSARCGVTAGYVTCEGAVRNLTAQPLEDLEVVILWADASGVVQASEDALLTYNPLLPGQESPWKVISRHNPALTKYRVEFKKLFGGTVPVRDDRETE